MLTFNLKKEWYEKIRSGEKRIEYREVKPYWTKRIYNALREYRFLEYKGDAMRFSDFEYMSKHSFCCETSTAKNFLCLLVLGYTKRRMPAVITKIEVVDGKDTDLHIDKPVYAIHLAEVRGAEK